MKHKHYKEIVAWAEGKEIETKYGNSGWQYVADPGWHSDQEYRVKDPYRELKEAYKEGKTLQFLWESCNKWKDWEPKENTLEGFKFGRTPEWYRVKPEPEHAPFTVDDARHLLGRSVMRKDAKGMKLIIGVNERGVVLPNEGCNFEYLFMYYTFLDGTPCGKLKMNRGDL